MTELHVAHRYGHWSQRCGSVFSILVGAMFLVAACGKLWDVESFYQSLRAWAILPLGTAAAASVAVPLIEVAAGLGLVLWPRKLPAIVFGGVVLAVFTIAYIAQTVLHGRPDCNCLGVLQNWLAVREQFSAILLRNAVLISMIAISGIFSWRAGGAHE